jgi:hypothetical protein
LTEVFVFGEVLFEGVGRMYWFVFFCGIFTGILEDDFWAARVF